MSVAVSPGDGAIVAAVPEFTQRERKIENLCHDHVFVSEGKYADSSTTVIYAVVPWSSAPTVTTAAKTREASENTITGIQYSERSRSVQKN